MEQRIVAAWRRSVDSFAEHKPLPAEFQAIKDKLEARVLVFEDLPKPQRIGSPSDWT